jgi:hypothetical protein
MQNTRELWNPRRRKVKPRGPLRIIKSRAPRRLLYCWPFSDVSAFELMQGLKPVLATGPELRTTPYGQGIALNNAAGVLEYLLPATWPTTTLFTLELIVWQRTAYTDQLNNVDIFALRDTSGTASAGAHSQFGLATGYPSFNDLWVIADDWATITPAGINPVPPGNFAQWVATWDGSNLNLYTQGAFQAGIALASPLTVGPCAYVNFGQFSSDVVQQDMVYLLANLANVAWTSAEIFERFANPFGFLQGNADIAYVVAAAAGDTLMGQAYL